MKILIAGDTVPTFNNQKLFMDGEIEKLLGGDLLKIWNSYEHKILNLETPLYDGNEKIKKTGVCLKANTECINAIKKLNLDVVCLANNHIMDSTEKGLFSTIEILEKNNIDYIGVGKNTNQLKKYIEIDKNTVCYNFCDVEFSGATNDTSGTNTYSEFYTFDDIRYLKGIYDNVIVIFHGGKEQYRYPTPKLQKICRKCVECGANIVVCQHSHCIGSYEKFNDSHIIYGQGNFLFCKYENEYWNTGMLIEYDSDSNDITFIPYIKDDNHISLLEKEDENYKILMAEFYKRNEDIVNNKIDDIFKKYCDENIERYLEDIRKKGLFFKIINKIANHKFSYLLYDEKQLLNMLNDFQCEAHKEIMLCGLKEKIFGGKDEK